MRRRLACLFLVLGVAAPPGTLPAAAPPARPPFAALSNREAWDRLPRVDPVLPAWARILAESLPLTTARMLELDHLHRARNPLGDALAAGVRREVADALGCDYARRYAEADLRRAADASKGLPTSPTRPERAALAFARKLTRAGHEVTDGEVAELIDLFGPEKVVALVHTVAHANFQGRIFLALNVAVEPGGPLPPMGVRFATGRHAAPPAPARPAWRAVKAAAARAPVGRPDWDVREQAELDEALARQKARKARIPMPGEARLARIPPEARAQASRIVWTAVSMGYQPRLTKAWFDCMGSFSQETRLDPVFSGSLFWVVTRTNECFY